MCHVPAGLVTGQGAALPSDRTAPGSLRARSAGPGRHGGGPLGWHGPLPACCRGRRCRAGRGGPGIAPRTAGIGLSYSIPARRRGGESDRLPQRSRRHGQLHGVSRAGTRPAVARGHARCAANGRPVGVVSGVAPHARWRSATRGSHRRRLAATRGAGPMGAAFRLLRAFWRKQICDLKAHRQSREGCVAGINSPDQMTAALNRRAGRMRDGHEGIAPAPGGRRLSIPDERTIVVTSHEFHAQQSALAR